MKLNNLVTKYLKLGLCCMLIFAVLIIVDIFKPRNKYIPNINKTCYVQSQIILWDDTDVNYFKSLLLVQLNLNQKILLLKTQGLKLNNDNLTFSYEALNYESSDVPCDEVNKTLGIALKEVKKSTIDEINNHIES